MGSERTSIIRRLLDAVSGLLPDGGIGRDAPAPDIDGRRDSDEDYRRAVLTAKSQMPPSGGHGATSYEQVDSPERRD